MPVDVLVALLIKITILVGLGVLLKKMGLINHHLQQGLSTLLLRAVLPFSVVASASNDYPKEVQKNLIKVAIIAFCYYIVAITISSLISKFIKSSDKGKKVFITMSVFANTAFMGFPIMSELYGNTGLLYAVVYNLFYQLFFFSYGISILSENGKIKIKEVLKNPVTIASLIAIAMFITGIKLPNVIQDTFTTIGGMMVPISMMIIGCSLAEMDIKELVRDFNSFFVSGLRLFVYPICMLMVMLLLRIPVEMAAVCSLMTALPSGSLNVIMSQEYDCEPGFAARSVVQTMLFSIGSIPLMIILINMIL